MKNKKIPHHLTIWLILFVIISSCKKEKNGILIEVKGPFYKETVTELFDLDSVPFNIHSRDLYIARLENNTRSAVGIEISSQDQIFPDSSWYHSYTPYPAVKRSWSPIRQNKPPRGTYEFKLPPNRSKQFWFSNYFDEYIDSMVIYFTIQSNDKKEVLVVNELYEFKQKPKIKFQLIESKQSKEFMNKTGIEINVEGPFTYQNTNDILNVNIPFEIDSEVVFLFEIKNNRDENLYIETWENKEINIDTIYSFSPFTQTATEYLWIENTTKKGAKPVDTIVLEPQETRRFWDSYDRIWPTTDSIAFIETLRTDEYLINAVKLYEVKKD